MSTFRHTEDTNKPEVSQDVKIKELDDEQLGNIEDDYIARFLGATDDAKEAENHDKTMSLLQAVKTYPKAAMWSIILSTVIIMEGYDTLLLGSFMALPAFTRKYGELTESGIYEVSAPWQTGLSMCSSVGSIIGLQFAGVAADKWGYKPTLIFALYAVMAFIFILFFAKNTEMLAAGAVLCGIPWGIFQTITISYASEVCPMVLRYYLTTYVNVCWVFGQLIGSGILKGLSDNETQWAYRIPFAIQWIYPIPISIAIYFAPEGPFWLVRKGRYNDAKKSLLRLMTKNESNANPEAITEMMVSKMKIIIEKETALDQGSSYWVCFRGVNARRTRIAIMTWVMQNWTGSALMGYSTYFYNKAGLDVSNAFSMSIAQYALGVLGTLISWTASNKFGRFELYFVGVSIQAVLLLIIGGLGCAPSSDSVSWAIGSLLLIFVFVYDSTTGPVTYCLVTEVPSAKVRTKTVVLARNFYNLAGILNAILNPYMLNTTAWNWGAKSGFFWAGFCCLFLVWMWFEMPETKDRTFAELDVLFEKGIKARKFKTTEVEPFEIAELVQKLDKDQIEHIVEAKETSTVTVREYES